MELAADTGALGELEVDTCGLETQCGSNRDTFDLNTEPSTLTEPIQLRIKQLLNRRLFLQETQCFWKTTHSDGTRASGELSVISDEADRLKELQAIEKELEELQPQEHQDQGRSSDSRSTVKSDRPCGGVYLLPLLHQEEEQLSVESRARTSSAVTTAAAVAPVDSLGQRSAITQCPSCREVVQTETSSSVSEATWTVCFLCSMLGCIGGCCLVPFFVKRLKNVSHQCPQCQAVIHTHKPL